MKISDSLVMLQARSSKLTNKTTWQADTVTGTPVGRSRLLSFQDFLTDNLNPSPAPVIPELESGSTVTTSREEPVSVQEEDSSIQAARVEEILNLTRNSVLLQTGPNLNGQNNAPLFGMGRRSYHTSLFDYHFSSLRSRRAFTVRRSWPTTFRSHFQDTSQGRSNSIQVGDINTFSNWSSNSINRPTMRREVWQETREDQQLQFRALGAVKTEDGRRITFDLGQNYTQSITELTRNSFTIRPFPLHDPLILDIDGQGIGFEDQTFDFDLDGDGTLEQLACLDAGCGFLAYDQNQDGSINNGLELFGTQTGNGFFELAEYDLDGNYWIDENDAIFNELSIWSIDEQGNEVTQSLLDAEVGAICLAKADSPFGIVNDSGELQGQISSSGIYLTENGEVQAIHQVDLADKAEVQEQANMDELQEPEQSVATVEA